MPPLNVDTATGRVVKRLLSPNLFPLTPVRTQEKRKVVLTDGFSPSLCLDRDRERTRKQHGGGVCLYVNNSWCSTVTVRECTTDIELLAVSLRPYYLPREFPQLFIILVFIHPRADAAKATQYFTNTLYKLEQLSPDSAKFILGDFNHCSPDKSLKGYQQYVTHSTRQG